ncbi:hypothetical protein MT325_m338R [Paramecium bursaria chlorella virus MT325]|uniref:Uncharacterized protein m338R n=1 Tax=Paramecium bursaria Chlorella virus MT325 TaxID=346932 RepID=A7IU68_PBCVM|nr:hypothetical protein MT325_m338R [Paramecium bursaria chlorella virus MT325]
MAQSLRLFHQGIICRFENRDKTRNWCVRVHVNTMARVGDIKTKLHLVSCHGRVMRDVEVHCERNNFVQDACRQVQFIPTYVNSPSLERIDELLLQHGVQCPHIWVIFEPKPGLRVHLVEDRKTPKPEVPHFLRQ